MSIEEFLIYEYKKVHMDTIKRRADLDKIVKGKVYGWQGKKP